MIYSPTKEFILSKSLKNPKCDYLEDSNASRLFAKNQS